MVGRLNARNTRSGTLVGPGIWRKWRPLLNDITPPFVRVSVRSIHRITDLWVLASHDAATPAESRTLRKADEVSLRARAVRGNQQNCSPSLVGPAGNSPRNTVMVIYRKVIEWRTTGQASR